MQYPVSTRTVTAACILCALFPAINRADVLVEKESLYHHIIITAEGSMRSMLFRRRGSDASESIVDISAPLKPQLPHIGFMFSGLLYCDQPEDILIVGLGGGTLSYMFNHYFPQASIVTVELDPMVFELAKTYFDFKESEKNKVVIRDGRVYVKRLLAQGSRRFDIILLDAFRGGYIPFHLTTKEFMTECAQLLKPGGLVVSNMRPEFETYQYQRRTLNAVFPTCQAFRTGNVVVCSLPSKMVVGDEDLKKRAQALQAKHRFAFDMLHVVQEREKEPDYEEQGGIFTDDYAPANILRRK